MPAAMILAAGRGERMRPLSDACPKPLLPVGGKPLIAHTILAARAARCVERVVGGGKFRFGSGKIGARAEQRGERYVVAGTQPVEQGIAGHLLHGNLGRVRGASSLGHGRVP